PRRDTARSRSRRGSCGVSRSSQSVRERLDRGRGRLELTRLKLTRDLAHELLRLALLIRIEHRVHGRQNVTARMELEVDGLELRAWDVGILGHADVDDDVPPVRQGRGLFDRS